MLGLSFSQRSWWRFKILGSKCVYTGKELAVTNHHTTRYHISEDLSLTTVQNCTTVHVVKSEGSSPTLALMVSLFMLRIWETLAGYQRAYLPRAVHTVSHSRFIQIAWHSRAMKRVQQLRVIQTAWLSRAIRQPDTHRLTECLSTRKHLQDWRIWL